MAINEIKGLSTTAGSNSDFGGNDISEGCAPSGLNNAMRSLGAFLKADYLDRGGAVSTAGSSNTYTLTTNATITAYADGDRFHAVANHASTGAATLNVDSVGAKAIKVIDKSGERDTATGDIISSGHYIFQYDASAASAAGAWILLNPAPGDTPDDIITTRGDIIYGDSSADAARLALGSAGQVLGSDGTDAAWTDPVGIIQTVQTVDTTNRSTTSTSFADSGVSVTITPSSASNDILVTVSGITGASAAAGVFITLYRSIGGGADAAITPSGVSEFTATAPSANSDIIPFSFQFLDSPATTSSVEYIVYFKSTSGATTVYLGRRGADTLFDSPTVVTASEIR